MLKVEKCNPVKVENNIDILYFYVSFWTKCGLTYLKKCGVKLNVNGKIFYNNKIKRTS